jgi:hypothetical protein
MASAMLSEIERSISHLSHDEQLLLIEQLAHHLRQDTSNEKESGQITFENQLAAMADDPQIQAETKKINKEFLETESDGLGS